MKDELLITPGEWKAEAPFTSEVQTSDNLSIASCWFDGCEGKELTITGTLNCSLAESEANAKLIAEAGTVYNETKLSPRQMAERIEELEHQLAMAEKAYNEACQHIRENTYPK